MKRILVVDDPAGGADYLPLLVKLWGHEPFVAYTAATALQLVRTYLPDVILLDPTRADLDAAALARQVRQEASSTPLLVALAHDPAGRRRAGHAPFDYCLPRAYDLLVLQRLLAEEADGRHLAGVGTGWQEAAVA